MSLLLLGMMVSLAHAGQKELDREFIRYETHELDLPQMAAAAATTRRLSIDIAGRHREMILEPVNLRARSLGPSHDWTYRGAVIGEPGSDVRLLLNDRLLVGYVRTAEGVMFIEPVYIYARGERPNRVVMYREEDVRPEFRAHCGGALLAPVAARLSASAAPASPGDLRQVEVATDADAEFFQIHGGMSEAFIEGIFNMVDGLYTSELGLKLEIVFQNVFTDPATDPYSATEASQLLVQFRTEWNSHRSDVIRDVAHLFTGKSLNGTTAGIGYLGVVCDAPDYAYALTSSSSLMARVTAHEMGHNFNAQHDDQVSPPAAVCNGSGPLMCSAIQPQGPFEFSQRSIDDITAFVAAHGYCLAFIPEVDLSVVILNVPNNLSVGEAINSLIVVSNAGPQDATGVTLTLTSDGVTVDSVTSALGDCSTVTNTITCGPASLPAGSSLESPLVIEASRAGIVCLNAAVQSDQLDTITGNSHFRRCATAAVYDLAAVKLKAPKRITLTSTAPSVTGKFSVVIQNRSSQDLVIPNLAALRDLVTVQVQSLGACPDVAASVQPPKATFPITLAPKKRLTLALTGVFDCANDALASTKTAPHPDYRTIAHVSRAALPDGISDAHTADDDCPHNPIGIDANPDGSIQDKGCGAKKPNGTLGGDVLTDVVMNP